LSKADTILVTGAARQLGSAVLRALAADPAVHRVVAVDLSEPQAVEQVDGVEYAAADLCTPAIATLLAKVRPETVLHLDVLAAPSQAGGRAAMKERNVIGTMQLLAACQRTPSVRRLVVKSSGAVYGCAPRDPALYAEDTEPHRPPRAGYGKDVAEVEGYVRGFSRRRPDVEVTVLRFAGFIGPGVRTPFVDYLGLPVLPTVFGFDPRLQFVHIDDVVRAVALAAGGTSHPGTYNIAGDGPLTITQIARRLGRPTMPVPKFATTMLAELLRRGGVADFTMDQLDLLTFGRVLDTARMHSRLGLTPKYSTAQALTAHAAAAEIRPVVPPDRFAAAESFLTGLLARRATGRGGAGDGQEAS
jgi:UDP-glucose 4-epimerase